MYLYIDLVVQRVIELYVKELGDISVLFYLAICRAVRPPPQNSAEAMKLGGGLTVRKSPIGEG